MDVKFGKMMQPIQCTMKMKQKTASNVGMFKNHEDKNFVYKFIRKTHAGMVAERAPERKITFEDPHTYRGQQGSKQSCFQGKASQCYIVNGWLHKADGNFLHEFYYNQIGNSNVLMGSYPLYEHDIQRL